MSDQEQMKRVMSYLIGYRIGSQILPQMLPGVQASDLLGEKMAEGLRDGLEGEMNLEILNEEADRFQQGFFAMLRERGERAGKENREAGRRYLEENGKRPQVVTTDSGLQYEVLTPGQGESYDPAKHGDSPTAEVMYKGTLIDGTVFDQSRKPVEFNISQVIPGFTEALKLMPIGARWKVSIPSHLAYGANGPGNIGPHSTLIFEMQLLNLRR